MICRPKRPKCEECPVSEFCQAYAEGAETEYPVKGKKAKVKKQQYAVLIIKNTEGSYLIHKRNETGLLANLYEFPMIQKLDDTAMDQSDLQTASLDGIILPESMSSTDIHITHTFSHLQWDLNVYTVQVKNDPALPKENFRWSSLEELEMLPFPVPHQKIKQHLGQL